MYIIDTQPGLTVWCVMHGARSKPYYNLLGNSAERGLLELAIQIIR